MSARAAQEDPVLKREELGVQLSAGRLNSVRKGLGSGPSSALCVWELPCLLTRSGTASAPNTDFLLSP